MKFVALNAVLVATLSCGTAQEARTVSAADSAAGSALVTMQARLDTIDGNTARPALTEEERRFYRDMGKTAWDYMERHYQPTTGFVSATPHWAHTTLWDIGGQFLAFHAAKEMGLMSQSEYDRRTRTALTTLEKVPLFRDAAFNKVYATKAVAFGEGTRGWSATDLGRFLLALRVVATKEPQHAAQAERVAKRNDFRQIVRDGYIHGQLIGSSGQPWTFQEGRIGYEQYAATGFKLWGADVRNALDVNRNAVPVDVMGVQLLGDKRKLDRLLSEPFVLYGLELGLTGDYGELAKAVLRAQEARYASTGKITIASEDAMPVAPEYFFYYCVYCNGAPFVVDISIPGKTRDSPRWVSTKGAFGWHALMPNEYTKKAIDYVSAARDPQQGWASGVYEGTGASTKTFDVNTAAVLLEVAYFQLRGGKPLLQPGPVLPD